MWLPNLAKKATIFLLRSFSFKSCHSAANLTLEATDFFPWQYLTHREYLIGLNVGKKPSASYQATFEDANFVNQGLSNNYNEW